MYFRPERPVNPGKGELVVWGFFVQGLNSLWDDHDSVRKKHHSLINFSLLMMKFRRHCSFRSFLDEENAVLYWCLCVSRERTNLYAHRPRTRIIRKIELNIDLIVENPDVMLDDFILPLSLDCIYYTLRNNIEFSLEVPYWHPSTQPHRNICNTDIFEMLVSWVLCRIIIYTFY